MAQHISRRLSSGYAAAALGLALVAAPAGADPIGPGGFDLLHTVPFVTTLGPLGQVALRGAPIGPGDTDTIVRRTGELPSGGTGTIDIELVALSLESSAPIEFGGSFFDVFVTINALGLPGLSQPDALQPSLGMITITSHDDAAGGGTFDSFFDVFADVTLVPVGAGQPFHTPAPLLHLENTGGTWSHDPSAGYPATRAFPANGFYPGPIPHQGAHPVVPSSPEPSTLLLLGAGTAALAAQRRGRGRAEAQSQA